jgi:phosphoribosyl-ATP pyrophosphohydrolase/phosphoribosyl-AMP cyclohydrolase
MEEGASVIDIKWNEQGLVPAVVQDANTGQVLMLAYMNQASLERTLETGESWFWSRSRGELWHKGATSGNTQRVVEVRYDCDADTRRSATIATSTRCCCASSLPAQRAIPAIKAASTVACLTGAG